MIHKNKNQLTTWAKILRAKRLRQGLPNSRCCCELDECIHSMSWSRWRAMGIWYDDEKTRCPICRKKYREEYKICRKCFKMTVKVLHRHQSGEKAKKSTTPRVKGDGAVGDEEKNSSDAIERELNMLLAKHREATRVRTDDYLLRIEVLDTLNLYDP